MEDGLRVWRGRGVAVGWLGRVSEPSVGNFQFVDDGMCKGDATECATL